jgi:hypothetical protein
VHWLLAERGRETETLALTLHVKARQSLAAHRLPQLQEPTSFDLPNPFPRDAVAASHFVQRSGPSIPEAKTQLDDFSLTRGQRSQHFADPLAQQVMIYGLAGTGGIRITQKVFERPFAIVAQGFVQADRVPANLAQGTGFLAGEA